MAAVVGEGGSDGGYDGGNNGDWQRQADGSGD